MRLPYLLYNMWIISKKNYIRIDDLEIYQIAMEIGDVIWDKVESWAWFGKQTLGSQIVRSADSIAGNIAEGYGRYFFKERTQFIYYCRGHFWKPKPGRPKQSEGS